MRTCFRGQLSPRAKMTSLKLKVGNWSRGLRWQQNLKVVNLACGLKLLQAKLTTESIYLFQISCEQSEKSRSLLALWAWLTKCEYNFKFFLSLSIFCYLLVGNLPKEMVLYWPRSEAKVQFTWNEKNIIVIIKLLTQVLMSK